MDVICVSWSSRGALGTCPRRKVTIGIFVFFRNITLSDPLLGPLVIDMIVIRQEDCLIFKRNDKVRGDNKKEQGF